MPSKPINRLNPELEFEYNAGRAADIQRAASFEDPEDLHSKAGCIGLPTSW